MQATTFAEKVVRRDRTIVLAGLASILLLSWAYTIYLAQAMVSMPEVGHVGMGMKMGMELAMPTVKPWGATDYWLMYIMWMVMQVAMMTPSAAPMVLMYTTFSRQQQNEAQTLWGTTQFYLGYLLVWTAFSAAAALLQGGLHAAALLSPMMETTSPILGGAILVATGIYQFTPLKRACLAHCRTPLGYFMTEWRDGKWGALVMGVRHGAFCVGCCWLLMALLLVSGVMNLFWIAILAAFVLLELVGFGLRFAGLAAQLWLGRRLFGGDIL